jgi:hypothetical protein
MAANNPGYAYGIDALSKGKEQANFVVNQGTDTNINVRAESILLNSGTTLTLQGTSVVVPAGTPLNVTTQSVTNLAADSIRLAGIDVGAAATPLLDFSTARNLAAFGGRYVWFQIGDGIGSSAIGYCLVAANGQLSNLHFTQGALTAPVTAVSATVASTVLSVVFTGKTATTLGTFQVMACTV